MEITKSWLYILLKLFLCSGLNGNKSISMEHRLYRDLLADYNPAVRPRQNSSQEVALVLNLAVFSVHINEKEEYLQTMTLLEQSWYDDYTVWDPANYGNITHIALESATVWKPDLFVINSAHSEPKDILIAADFGLISGYNGKINALFYGKMKTTCNFSMETFPFDTQECSILIGPFKYENTKVNITNAGVGRGSFYVNNSSWKLKELLADVHHYTMEENCDLHCGLAYSSASFNFKLHRKSSFYMYSFILPCIALSLLPFLTFFIPPDSGERLSVCLTCLVSFSVLLSLIANDMPASVEEYPVIASYLCAEMAMVFLSTVMSIIVINMYRYETSVRSWLQAVGRSSAVRLLCMSPIQKRGKEVKEITGIQFIPDIDMQENVHGDNKETPHNFQKDCLIDLRFVATMADRLFFFVYIILNGAGFLQAALKLRK